MADSRVININGAERAELAQIAEIGIQHARKIIEYRGQTRRFKTIDELSKVPGIVEVILRDIRTKRDRLEGEIRSSFHKQEGSALARFVSITSSGRTLEGAATLRQPSGAAEVRPRRLRT